MNDDKNLTPSLRPLREWLELGKDKEYFEGDLQIDLNRKGKEFRDWLDEGRVSRYVNFRGVTKADIADLSKRFHLVISVLVSAIFVSFTTLSLLVRRPASLIWIAVVAGILGSATAALVSSLDRWAGGFEDLHGNAYPDPTTKKGRFNLRFSYWLLVRPVLGVTVATLVFYGANYLIPADKESLQPTSPEAAAFLGGIAGLFAKTLIEILMGIVKGIFGKT